MNNKDMQNAFAEIRTAIDDSAYVIADEATPNFLVRLKPGVGGEEVVGKLYSIPFVEVLDIAYGCVVMCRLNKAKL